MDTFFENLNVHPKFGINTRQAIPGQVIKRIYKTNQQGNQDQQRRQFQFLKGLMQRQQNISDPQKKLQFENIISIHQIHETENYLYIVMEECEEQLKQNISKFDSRIRGNQKEIFQIAQQLVKGYKFLKTTQDGLYHGYINLDNIYIKTINGRTVVKISDFGIKNKEEVLIRSCIFKEQIYTAPEIQQNLTQKPTIQSDIYSIGICLYHLLFGLKSQIVYQSNRLELDISQNNQLAQLIVEMTHLQQNERISWADLEERILYQHPLLFTNQQTINDDKSEFIQRAQSIMKYYKVLEVNDLHYNDFIRKNKSYYKYFKSIESIIRMLEQTDCMETYMLVQLIIFISSQDLSIYFSEVQQLKYQNLEFIQIKQYFIKISAQTSIYLSKQDQVKNINQSQYSGQRQQLILSNLQKRCQKPKYFQKFIQTYHCDPEDKGCCQIQ